MASIKLQNISKIFGKETKAVKNISLDIGDKEFVVLVGPSGCGKSTTLRMVAGLEEISDGQLLIDDLIVNDIPPKDRDIAMVFQNYALYPHMSVYNNMAFGLKLKQVPKNEITTRVTHAAKTVGLLNLLDRKPKELSGGQRQRVALGRAIVRNPKVFLFDEPLSNLDAKLRTQMRVEIVDLQKNLGVTTLYVTHDQVEAMTMADRIAVLNDGILQQFDKPLELYQRPKNVFVAGFIGSPSMNFIEADITDNQELKINQLNYKSKSIVPPPSLPKGSVILGIRPENLILGKIDRPDAIVLNYTIRSIEPLGSETILYLAHGDQACILKSPGNLNASLGDQVYVSALQENIYFFDKETGTTHYF